METAHEYRLEPEAFGKVKFKLILRSVLFTILIYGFVVAIKYNQQKEQSWFTWIALAVISGGAMAYGVSKAIGRAKQSWNSYVVRIGDGVITRRCDCVSDLNLASDDITQIDEMADTGLYLRTKDATRFIFVSQGLIGYEEFVKRLEGIHPIQRKSAPVYARLIYFLAVCGGSLLPMYFALASKDDRIAIAGCVAVVAMLFYCGARIQKDKNIDDNVKKSMWVMYLVIFSMVLNAGFRLFQILK